MFFASPKFMSPFVFPKRHSALSDTWLRWVSYNHPPHRQSFFSRSIQVYTIRLWAELWIVEVVKKHSSVKKQPVGVKKWKFKLGACGQNGIVVMGKLIIFHNSPPTIAHCRLLSSATPNSNQLHHISPSIHYITIQSWSRSLRHEIWNLPTLGCKGMIEGPRNMLGVLLTLLYTYTTPIIDYCSTCMLL